MESCRPIFINNKILTSTCIYILESILFIKQNSDLFSEHSRNHNYNTRSRDDLVNIKSNFSYIQKNVQFSVIAIFNKLPLEWRNLNVGHLRYKLKSHLLQRAYYAMEEYFDDDFG